jgi:nucleotide-binding universal stress UspA family protein
MYRDRIVVGVDGSPGSYTALMWAADECRLRRRPLLIVHAPDGRAASILASAGEPARRALNGAGLRLLDTHLIAASARQPGVPVTSLLGEAGPADALIDLSAGADLLVVGTRGNYGFASSMLGSVSTRVAAQAHCPVVVVPQGPVLHAENVPLPILVGASGSPAGRLAFEFALAEAQHRQASVLALCASQGVDATEVTRAVGNGRSAGPTDRNLPSALLQIQQRYPDVIVEPRFVRTVPSEALLTTARDAQLMVVGCHHSDDHWSTRLGPIASSVLHCSPCPVAVVGERHKADRTPEQDFRRFAGGSF